MLKCTRKKIEDFAKQGRCRDLADETNRRVLLHGRPVVLSQKRYNILKQHAGQEDEKALELKEKEKLKAAAALAIQSLYAQRTPEEKLAEIKKKLEVKAAQARASLAASQHIAEIARREKIAKAELLIQKLKAGPRELRSAAIQSEMLRAHEVQLEVNAIIQDSIKKQELADQAACQEQASIFLGEDHKRIQERKELEKEYRKEMCDFIREHERIRCENRRAAIEEGRRERARIDCEIEEQRRRERLAIEKKREQLRKNAVEAMKMVEERKKREAMYGEADERLCCVYNAGRHQLEQLKAQQEKEFVEDRKKQIDNNTEMLAKIQQKIQNNEAERLRRDIDTMKLKFDEEERKKRDREKEAKRQRIEAHLQEMEQIRKCKERENEQKRFEIAQRFKNCEVNARFDEADRLEQQQRAKCVRAQLMAQEQERQRLERERIAKSRCDNTRNDQDDNYFFKYAHSLMVDGKVKQRPLYPYRRVINNYKRENMRELQPTKLPRHMVCNVNVQYRDPPKVLAAATAAAGVFEATAAEKKSAPQSERSPVNMVKAETLEHMAKIDAMLAEEERMRLAKSTDFCKPFICLNEANGTNSKRHDGLQEISVPADEDACQNQETASAKLHYGIQELKLLGTPAPSVH